MPTLYESIRAMFEKHGLDTKKEEIQNLILALCKSLEPEENLQGQVKDLQGEIRGLKANLER